MLKLFEKYLIIIFLFATGISTLILLPYMSWCEQEFYDNYDNQDHLGILVAFLMFFNIFLQVLTHIILLIINLLNYFKSKRIVYLHKIYVFLFALLSTALWLQSQFQIMVLVILFGDQPIVD
jgi:hypothetical protein